MKFVWRHVFRKWVWGICTCIANTAFCVCGFFCIKITRTHFYLQRNMVMFRHEHAVWTMWTCSAKMVFFVFDDFMYRSYMDSFENCVAARYTYVWSAICLCVSKISRLHYYINTCSAFGSRLWFTFESDGVHLRPTWKCGFFKRNKKIAMRFTSTCVAVHLPSSLRCTLIHEKMLKKRQQKLVWEKIYVPQKKSWSLLVHLVQCGFHSEVVWSPI